VKLQEIKFNFRFIKLNY